MSSIDDWVTSVHEQENDLAKKAENLSIVTPSSPPPPSQSGGGDATKNTPEAEEDDKPVSKADISLLNKKLRSHLVSNKSDIEVLRRDPKSPLYSVKSFEKLNLKPELLKGIYRMNFMTPSKIQETALPALLGEQKANMIAQSQSGTGKTAAFVLTMLSRVDVSKDYTQCICLAPTYELALQIGDVTKEMAHFMEGVNIGFAIRGCSVSRRDMVPYHIIIGTPGTMVDWCCKWKVVDMSKICVFVLDEADVMIDSQGHQDQSMRVRKTLKSDCQILLFSATYDEEVMKFANHVVPNPMIIRLKREEESLENIKQYYIECNSTEEKYKYLCNIYAAITIGQAIIFCHTRKSASWLAEKMSNVGHKVGLLSGELTVEQRAAVISRFREGKERLLISTNVSARGIDVEQVTVVVNFDLPVDIYHRVDFETYLHRIGRTGRFGKDGLAINMIDNPAAMQMLKAIESHFGRPIHELDGEDLEGIEKIQEL